MKKGKGMQGPLSGITILDMSRVLAGPFCTMVLSELGARVIKAEIPPAGDDSRQFGPFVEGKSAYFMSLNRGKESICIDLKEPGERKLFEKLLAGSDVLVENFRPGTLAKLGYDWESLHAAYPRLVYAALSGFGHTGPKSDMPAYDLVIQAMGGIMSITGYPGNPPTRVGSSMGDITAGLFTSTGICAALRHREISGQGMMIDVSMLDCQVAILENAIARYAAEGISPGPLGARHPSITPFDVYATGDGYMVICAGNQNLFAKLCRTLGRDELIKDKRFANNDLRTSNQAALKQEMESTLRSQGNAHWLDLLGQKGIPCGPINNLEGVLNDPQVNARNMLVEALDPTAGKVRMAGNPIKMSCFEDPPERRPAPDLDQSRQDILDLLRKKA